MVEWMRRVWRLLAGDSLVLALCRVVLVLALLGAGALAFVAAGLVPVAASEGHWAVTRVLLQFTMRSSVRTRTLGIQPPPLDGPDLLPKAAGHYATACMACHGAPGEPRALVVRGMTPEPPFLPGGFDGLRDRELFWIVRHGIKYTAMPAWPGQGGVDEVWAVVACLRELPGMDAATFQALANGEHAGIDLAPGTLADGERCHGRDGMGRPGIPRLAGQEEAYLRASLAAFADGRRHSGIMQPVAAELDAGEIDRLAAHFAGLAGRSGDAACAGPEAAGRGAVLARHGDPDRKIPACNACHGRAAGDRNPMYP